MKVKIFTIANIRPDFIEIQYESIKKFLKDKDFEFIVYNNSFNNKKRYELIENICRKLKIENIKVNHYRDNKNDASLIVADSLNYIWNKYLKYEKDILLYIDSDMFLIKDTSVEELMRNYDFAFISNYRGKDFEIKYPWTGFMIFNMNTLPNPIELKWDTGIIFGNRVDVGGLNHYYLSKYENRIRILNLEMWTLNDIDYRDNNIKNIKGSINGNAQLSLSIDKDNKLIEFNINDIHLSRNRLFPYQKENEKYGEIVKNNYIEFEKYIKDNNLNFPKPIYIDLIKTYESKFNDCFILHYKSGSNWLNFSTKEYNHKKTEALVYLMKKLGVNITKNNIYDDNDLYTDDKKYIYSSKMKLYNLYRRIINKIIK